MPNLIEQLTDEQWSGPSFHVTDPQISVVIFTAKWCLPGDELLQSAEIVAKSHRDVRWLHYDVDEQREMSGLLELQGVPAIGTFRRSVCLELHYGHQAKRLIDAMVLRAKGAVTAVLNQQQLRQAEIGDYPDTQAA